MVERDLGEAEVSGAETPECSKLGHIPPGSLGLSLEAEAFVLQLLALWCQSPIAPVLNLVL